MGDMKALFAKGNERVLSDASRFKLVVAAPAECLEERWHFLNQQLEGLGWVRLTFGDTLGTPSPAGAASATATGEPSARFS
jgi:hypothetical protein